MFPRHRSSHPAAGATELDTGQRIAPRLSIPTTRLGERTARDPIDLLHGTLDVLVLKTLSRGAMHGYGISRLIEERTRGVLEIEDAALSKSLHRLERAGSIDAEWGVSDNNRKAKFYNLTARGRQELRAEANTWRQNAAAIFAVLESA